MIDAPHIDLVPLLPVLIVFGGALIELMAVPFARRRAQEPFALGSIVILFAAAVASLFLWGREAVTVLQGAIVLDHLAVVGTLIILGVGAYGVYLGYHYFQSDPERRNELYPLLLFAVGGMALLVTAADLIVVFIAVEILSLSLYVLAAFTFRRGPVEAAMKYFLLGAFASAFLLYGVAMAYGAAATTSLTGIADALSGRIGSRPLALTAVVLLLVGLGFKVSLVPFHMWTPDVYQGAPTAVTAFMSAGTKVAVFVGLVRVLDVAFAPLGWDARPLVWALAAVSMVVGSVLAIAQRDAKRMLAYSSVAQAGFILTAFSSPDRTGIAAALFYLVVYSVSVVGAFGCTMLATGGVAESSSFERFHGLARRRPGLAALFTLFLLSLAGIPPTAGFIAKASVFGAAVDAGSWPLALIGVIASVIGAFFYLRLVVLMYMRDPEGDDVADPAIAPRLALVLPGLAVLVLGVVPGVLVPLLRDASVLNW